MEPNDLNSPAPAEDAQLDAWLRTHAALPPLPDDGFSRNVLAALPPPQKSRTMSRRLAIALGAVAGIGFAAWQFFAGTPVEFNLPAPDPEIATVLAQLADPKLHTALGVTVLALAFVFWRDLRRRVGL